MTDTNSDHSSEKATDPATGYTSHYTLNREYFAECFDESANTASGFKAYRQVIIFLVVAGLFFALEVNGYAAWFLLCLGGIELLSIRYKRSWWIARQMLSRAAGSQVTIRIDEQGIFTSSSHNQQAMLWDEVNTINSTEKGFVVSHNRGTSYLSKNGLSEQALVLLAAKKTT